MDQFRHPRRNGRLRQIFDRNDLVRRHIARHCPEKPRPVVQPCDLLGSLAIARPVGAVSLGQPHCGHQVDPGTGQHRKHLFVLSLQDLDRMSQSLEDRLHDSSHDCVEAERHLAENHRLHGRPLPPRGPADHRAGSCEQKRPPGKAHASSFLQKATSSQRRSFAPSCRGSLAARGEANGCSPGASPQNCVHPG